MESLNADNHFREIELLIEMRQNIAIDLSKNDKDGIYHILDKFKPIVINPLTPIQELPHKIGCEAMHEDELESFFLALDYFDSTVTCKKVIVFENFEEFTYSHFYEGLRGTIQHHDNVTYVFLVNSHEAIVEIFFKYKNPFFRFVRIF